MSMRHLTLNWLTCLMGGYGLGVGARRLACYCRDRLQAYSTPTYIPDGQGHPFDISNILYGGGGGEKLSALYMTGRPGGNEYAG